MTANRTHESRRNEFRELALAVLLLALLLSAGL